jgi:pimeloyl-ACP methyl ester carboxylesterase
MVASTLVYDRSRRRGPLRFVLHELAAYALHGALGPLGRRPRPGADPGPTVLFVHGHGGNGAVFALLERALRRRGHHRFAAWEYASRGSVDAIAERLGRWARAAHPAGELHVVGHSLGGVIARAWLQSHGGRPLARSFVTLSSPHRGLGAVPGAGLVPLVRELAPGSPLLRRLDAGSGALDGLPCLSVVSTRDHFVRPWSNAGFGAARVAPVDDVGHVGVLFSATVHGLVADHLEASV